MKLKNGPDPYEVPDNGRRGEPLPGCMVDPDVRMREGLRRAVESERAGRDEAGGIPL